MEKLNILVTGANGFIGRSFLKKLNKEQYNVSALFHKNPSCIDLTGIKKYYQQDITRRFQLDQEFDFIYHFAAYNITHVGSKDLNTYKQVNVRGTENLINAARCKSFILMSTAKVYKPQGKPITEDSPLGPETDYARSKLEAEQVCQDQFKGDNLIIFRSINIVGNEQKMKAVIPVFFDQAVSGMPLEIIAPRDLLIQMLYVEDAVKLFQMILEEKRFSGVFNLASSELITIEDLARKIVQQCRSDSPVNFKNSKQSVQSVVNYDKLKKIIAWRPETAVSEILAKYHQKILSIHEK